jgi:hypothetical protein
MRTPLSILSTDEVVITKQTGFFVIVIKESLLKKWIVGLAFQIAKLIRMVKQ